MSKKIEVSEASAPVATGTLPKREIIRLAILEGGATRESLMKTAGVNKAGFASQLSYLNLIAQGESKSNPEAQVFPLTNADGVFYLGTLAEYQAKNANRGTGKVSTPLTAEQIAERAQKREDRASSKLTNAQKRVAIDNSIENTLRLEIAERELKLAGILLSKVQAGDYSSENATLVDEDQNDQAVPDNAGDEDSAMI